MKIRELIAELQKHDPESVVQAWDAYSDRETDEVYVSDMHDGATMISCTNFGTAQVGTRCKETMKQNLCNCPNCQTDNCPAATQSDRALIMIREATDHALDEAGLVEAVSVLISQRDNARHCADTFRAKLKELGHEFV
jgi:hypothetical protein